MSERKSRNNEEQKPTIALRRSPRFLRVNQSDLQNPGTPKTASRKIDFPDSLSTPLGSSVTKTLTKCGEISLKGARKGTEYVNEKRATRSSVRRSKLPNNNSECNGISRLGDRRSVRLENVSKIELPKIEKRVTRMSVCRSEKCVKNQVTECVFEGKKGNVVVDLSEYNIGKIEKRVTRSSSRGKSIALVEKGSDGTPRKMVTKGQVKNVKSKKDEEECGIKRAMRIGEKRKRCQVGEESEGTREWSEEQELALQRAYLTAKPTPHFWKKVAKMVPGKSAEECFDRIQSDQLTPSEPRARSRTNTNKPSPLSFSATKLLGPTETKKSKKLRPTKRNTLLAQKTVRSLLLKQQNEDQLYVPDFFSVLEPTVNPCSPNIQANASQTPNEKPAILTRCRETSSSAHKKQFSRLNGLSKAGFVSPPVLKQVKNKALHEKYIDQLHCREAKRKVESLRNAKGKIGKKVSELEVDSIKVAKDALVFDAQDAISQFQSLQSRVIDNSDDDDDDMSDSDELC